VYRMQCYTDDISDSTDPSTPSSSAVSFPVTVTVGDLVYCRVNVSSDVWDRRLQLIVPNCSFSTAPPTHGHNTTRYSQYQFIVNKYVTLSVRTPSLGIVIQLSFSCQSPSVTCQTPVRYLSITCQTPVSHLSNTCQSPANHLSNTCQSPSVTCQTPVSHLSIICQTPVNHHQSSVKHHQSPANHLSITCQSSVNHLSITINHLSITCQSSVNHHQSSVNKLSFTCH